MELQIKRLPFPQHSLDRWLDRDYDPVLSGLKDGSFIKRILAEKLRNRRRPGRRFFGEAFVAAHLNAESIWYGSFKWLTSWPVRSVSPFGNEFRAALKSEFPAAPSLSAQALLLRAHLGGKKPVPPDLWLVKGGQHQFVEVKLPGDTVRPTQVAGLAAIAAWLAPGGNISVWVYDLYPDGQPEPTAGADLKALYRRFSDICARPNTRLQPTARTLKSATRRG